LKDLDKEQTFLEIKTKEKKSLCTSSSSWRSNHANVTYDNLWSFEQVRI